MKRIAFVAICLFALVLLGTASAQAHGAWHKLVRGTVKVQVATKVVLYGTVEGTSYTNHRMIVGVSENRTLALVLGALSMGKDIYVYLETDENMGIIHGVRMQDPA